MKYQYYWLGIILLMLAFLACQQTPQHSYTNWGCYLGDKQSSQSSPLTQINKKNIQELKIAWTYHTGDPDKEKNRTQIQCNPLVIDGILYGLSLIHI